MTARAGVRNNVIAGQEWLQDGSQQGRPRRPTPVYRRAVYACSLGYGLNREAGITCP